MPGLIKTYNPAHPVSHANIFHNAIAISGFWMIHGIDFGLREFHIAWQWREGGGSNLRTQWRWTRVDEDMSQDQLLARTCDLHPLAAFVDSICANPAFFNGHRSSPGSDDASGIPQVACGWHANEPDQSVWAFWPDAANPGSWPPKHMNTGSYTYWPSLAVSHQGRHIIFDHRPDPHGPGHAWNHNEDIFFTRINTQVVENPGAPAQFGLETASGYVCAISTSHSELLLIKSSHGGLVIRGDLEFADAITIPGIPMCGGGHHQGAASPVGAVFITSRGGAYLWNGGELAEQISQDAVDPNAFHPEDGWGRDSEVGGIGRVWYWYDWIIFPNNWAWNWKQQTWWRLEDPARVKFFWCGPDYHVQEARFLATPSQVKSASDPVIYEYDYNVPASNYVWTSLPLPVLENRQFKIREVVFVVSGACDWTFDFWNLDGTTERHAFTTTRNDRPTYLRRNANVTAQEIKLRIAMTKGATAGIVHEVRMGLQEDVHYPHDQA